MVKRMLIVLATVLALGPVAALAQVSDGVIKIGVLNDQSSLYADLAGQGSVVAARMAVEDFGADKKGMKVEIISADHQNKPDVGSAIARQWYDVDKVDVILAVPNSGVALAVNQITRDKGKACLSGRGHRRSHGQSLLAQHHPRAYDTRGSPTHRQCHRQDGGRHVVLHHRRLRLRPRSRARRGGGGHQERREGAGQGAPSPQHGRLLVLPAPVAGLQVQDRRARQCGR
jgi:hypothetical protein